LNIRESGNIGIGTDGPDHDLEIGTGTYSEIDAGESQFTTSSSRTYKENIAPVKVSNVLEKVSNIPVNTYDFKPEYCNDGEDKCKNKLGLIAEDFHMIFERGSEKEIRGQEVQMALWLTAQELIKENQELKQNDKEIQEALILQEQQLIKQQQEIDELKQLLKQTLEQLSASNQRI